MRYFLENETLKVEIDSKGAELKSVLNKADYREYMWYGNGKFWGRTSPVLFPFIGSLKDKKYIWKGKEYPMGQHGFARDYEHKLVSQTENEIWFSFESDEETLEKYPFPFVLELGYRLEENRLEVLWRVKNPAEETMYFSIGAHPAFLCPVHGENSKTGYKLWFEGVDEIHHHGNDVPTGLSIREDLVIPLNNHAVEITDTFFDRCTYMIEGKQTGKMGIMTPDDKMIVDVAFDTPLFAIWSPEGKNAPFLCIEPWYGRCDAVDFDGELQDREFTNVLVGGETFQASYTITYHQV